MRDLARQLTLLLNASASANVDFWALYGEAAKTSIGFFWKANRTCLAVMLSGLVLHNPGSA
ncbi:hypothetical protein [Wenzhouxiangella sp. XN24]|uniref:hypothetical protein n=1 Tax=Wenzhouxiangella sp. XN24 TaxID=2713569 RepID=UPI0013EBC6A2|nr:hypothetical protein [Wenzhouxiangella sp. XN24]NGX17131.1 hypothetical protein [Wenzhouxiangella sp. XN24]